jgi:hypothetical protein
VPPGKSTSGERFSQAFGIGIRADFAAPGLPTCDPVASGPITQLEMAEEEVIEAMWRPSRPERLATETFEGTQPDRTIDFDEQLGYRFYARHFGLALITPSGDRVLVAPPGPADWSWQRFLVGRVLPWTALLRGREVFHASAVQIGGRAAAIVAPTGRGKSSIALRLLLRGAGFITDDVLALEQTPNGIRAHPGANIIAIRDSERERIDAADWRQLGNALGTSGKTYVEVEREPEPLALDAIYFLRPAGGGHPAIDPGVEARELLASSFIWEVSSPGRLEAMLDLCGEISTSTSLYRLSVPADCDAEATAELVWGHHAAAVGALP